MNVITYTEPVELTDRELPGSYRKFVATYGFGTYCGIINLHEPDEQVIPLTFSGLDLWEFDAAFSEEDLEEAVQLAVTSDGDSVCSVPRRGEALFVLPKSSETVLSFGELEAVLAYYRQVYRIPEPYYFEPAVGRNTEQFSLTQEGRLLDITPIHERFLEAFTPDYVLGTAQPKYVIAKMGGWVGFDLVYRNSITISYQVVGSHTREHLPYYSYLQHEVKEGGNL
ncbi:hypothetical protein [Neolewinella sp.]|uniref:hypothetical protein n=1 Tax=Neolewinella sp. TaxID=2993543 RepID=UPI003B52FD63